MLSLGSVSASGMGRRVAGWSRTASPWGLAGKRRLHGHRFRLTDPDTSLPRLRTTLLWKFLPWAFVQVGGDDMLVEASRDVFFGAGLAFTDNDLMMLFMGTPTVQFR